MALQSKSVLARARKAIANFKLKPNQVVGCSVTLRGPAMWEFLYRLLSVALPTIRDFRGVGSKLDGQGNYNLGITDHSIFPEITVENIKKLFSWSGISRLLKSLIPTGLMLYLAITVVERDWSGFVGIQYARPATTLSADFWSTARPPSGWP